MLNAIEITSELYQQLRPLVENPFTKECPTCGHIFQNFDEFISQTQTDLRSSGLVELVKTNSRAIVGLYRHCSCGEMLLVLCKGRRDTTEEGIRRRIAFGEILESLKAAGVDAAVARQELLKIVRGEESDLIKKFATSAPPENAATIERLGKDQ